jgi:RHH-type transcriptional regulator, rel operon repressor / antitoxin RelB
MLAIRLPPEIEKQLDRLAKRTGRTKTFYARQAIMEHIDSLEDYYLGERRYDEHLQIGKPGLSTAELKKKHGLDD